VTSKVIAPAISILDACADPALFARWFRDRATWTAWFAFLRVLFGLAMTDEDLALFVRCTGRSEPPVGGVREAWLICGRRAGKSFVLALVAVFLACFVSWTPFLTLGELGTVMVIAADRKQARVIYRYAAALLREVPMLKAMIQRETAEAIELTNGIRIEILTASFRTVRGYTLIAALCDLSGDRTKALIPTARSLEQFARPWRPSRVPCFCALPPLMRDEVHYGPLTVTSSAKMGLRWSGKLIHGP
jgi:hypothetical protein